MAYIGDKNMPLKTIKKDTAYTLTLEWILHVKHYRLTLDKDRCIGCQICSLACPKDAIKLEKQPKVQGQKAKKPRLTLTWRSVISVGYATFPARTAPSSSR